MPSLPDWSRDGHLTLHSVLSAFEESSAACISDMLRQVSNGQYLEAIRMAEKFILHVEVLFATIDDLEYHFARLKSKGLPHYASQPVRANIISTVRHVARSRSENALS